MRIRLEFHGAREHEGESGEVDKNSIKLIFINW